MTDYARQIHLVRLERLAVNSPTRIVLIVDIGRGFRARWY